jgi:hypothetical protein
MRTKLVAFDSRYTTRTTYTIHLETVEAGAVLALIGDGLTPSRVTDSQDNTWVLQDSTWTTTVPKGGELVITALFPLRIGTVVHVFQDNCAQPSLQFDKVADTAEVPPVVADHTTEEE